MIPTDRRLQSAGGNGVLLGVEIWQRGRARKAFSEVISEQPEVLPVEAGSGLGCDAGEPQGSPEGCGVRGDDIAELRYSLEALKELYRTHTSMEGVLRTASRLVVQIVNLEHCSIVCFDKHEFGFCVRASHTKEGADVDPVQAARALSDFARRERSKHDAHVKSSGGFDPHREGEQACGLTAPLRIDKQIVGYLYGLRSRFSNPQFFDADRSLFVTLSQHINAAIEAQRLREMMDCPYAVTVLDAKERRCFSSVGAGNSAFSGSVKHPEEFVRRIGRGFFDDLHRAGFEARQIVSVATEIIDSLNTLLRKTHAGRRSC